MPIGLIPSERTPEIRREIGVHALAEYKYALWPDYYIGALIDVAGQWAMGETPPPASSSVQDGRASVQFGPSVTFDPWPWLACTLAAGLRINSASFWNEDSPAGLFF